MVARAAMDPSGKLVNKLWRFFAKQAKGKPGDRRPATGNEEPESQTPRSQAEFEQMMKEEAE